MVSVTSQREGFFVVVVIVGFSFSSEFHYELFPLRHCSTDIFLPLGRDESIL